MEVGGVIMAREEMEESHPLPFTCALHLALDFLWPHRKLLMPFPQREERGESEGRIGKQVPRRMGWK